MTKRCAHCAGQYSKSSREAYRKFESRRFCSNECSVKFHAATQITRNCEQCGGEYVRPDNKAYAKTRFCSRRCRGLAENPQVPDVEFKSTYRQVKLPDGRKINEHRWVMEQHVGRQLGSTEHVHHINHDTLDNRIENLELVSISEHGERHTWRPLTTVCPICSTEFVPHKTKRGITKTCGQSCGAQLTWRTRRERGTDKWQQSA